MPGIATQNAPDVRLPLTHILTGVAAALLGGLALLAWAPGLLAQPLGNFHALAVTHLFTLGWLAMTLTGASYQLVPVVLEVRLRSEPLARAGYPVLAAGVALLVAGFWSVHPLLLAAGAFAVAAALLVYAAHVTLTVLQSRAHRMYRLFFLGASAYLVVVCFLGATMAASLRWGGLHRDLLPAHVIAAALGWLTLLAMGVAYKLVPMFALSHGHGEGRGTSVFGLAAGGALLLLLGAAWGWAAGGMAAAGALVLCAVGLFIRDQWLFLRTRHKPRLDVGLKLSAVAFGYLGLVSILGWLALAGAVRLGHGALVILALLGWLGCLMAGQTYKIVPFLVWYHRYAGRAGREKVPLLREMYSERLAGMAMWPFASAGALIAAGAAAGVPGLERLGALCWLAGYGTLAVNLVQVLRA